MSRYAIPERPRTPIRHRCLKFIQALREQGHAKEIPLEIAKEIFCQQLGFFDRTTLKAYFGTQAHRSVRKIERRARYPTGTISFKSIELSQDISQKKGYLEMLGLVSIERKGQTWFLKIKEESIVPELSPQYHERTNSQSIVELSLSTLRSEGVTEDARGKKDECFLTSNTQTNNNIQDEREKFHVDNQEAEGRRKE
ncbi:hypothetical protein MUP77_24960 [Candidatus Bathyarchaeota archaeon]|nr:hypothetical protein [Candidatus Bathyarchaeota archaeon]